jgi:hypothetical protein
MNLTLRDNVGKPTTYDPADGAVNMPMPMNAPFIDLLAIYCNLNVYMLLTEPTLGT